MKNEQEAVKEEVTETHVQPTSELCFKDGVLHQMVIVSRSNGLSTPELRPVPDRSDPKPAEAPSA